MTLPADYKDPLQYFTASVEFLKEYSWIYQHSNTAFLKSNVLHHFPIEFRDYFLTISNEELNEFPLLCLEEKKITKNEKLQNFRSKLKSLIPHEAFKPSLQQCSSINRNKHFRKMNLKKQHEITQLARLITELCENNHLLIDFGAGLGYLSEMLCTLSNNKFLILGLESEAERVHAAEKRRFEYLSKASNRIIYKQQFINETSLPFITATAEEHCLLHDIEQPKMAIVGLHACADLTITAMRIFFDMGPELTRLIIMPCCYHKMEMISPSTFRNFPLSQALKIALETDQHYFNYLNRPFLRLACQQTLVRWQNTSPEEHKLHGMEMFRRGIAEAIIDDDTEYVVKRKGVPQKIKDKCFDDGFDVLSQIYELKSKVTNESLHWHSHHEQRFTEIQTKYPEGYRLAEGLTCLQTSMQKLCENIVLFDRLCYMQEYALTLKLNINVRYEKLLDEKLSPRCYVLIAEKL